MIDRKGVPRSVTGWALAALHVAVLLLVAAPVRATDSPETLRQLFPAARETQLAEILVETRPLPGDCWLDTVAIQGAVARLNYACGAGTDPLAATILLGPASVEGTSLLRTQKFRLFATADTNGFPEAALSELGDRLTNGESTWRWLTLAEEPGGPTDRPRESGTPDTASGSPGEHDQQELVRPSVLPPVWMTSPGRFAAVIASVAALWFVVFRPILRRRP